MKRTVQGVAKFLVWCCSLVFFALFFYQMTNNLYVVNGRHTDYSLWGWAVMLMVWSVGFRLYLKKQKSGMLIFAAQLVIVCYAFDCWRLLLYADDKAMKLWILGLTAVEAVVLATGFYARAGQVVRSATAAGLIIFFGYYIMYPLWLPVEKMMFVGGICALVVAVWQSLWLQWHRRTVRIGMAVVIIIILGGGIFRMWLETPGIRFYEAKVTEPAKEVKVSVVVPVYNAEKYLRRCLDSLRKQTLKDIEIICVNDGSTDRSAEILAEYATHDKRIKVITQENQYIGAARNRGIDTATGEYIGFVDSDDWVSPNYFADLYKVAKKHDTDVAVAGRKDHVHRWRQMSSWSNIIWVMTGKDVFNVDEDSIYKVTQLVWDKIYRRDFLNRHKIRFPTLRVMYEDFHFTVSVLLYALRVAIAKDSFYYYNVADFSVSRYKLEENDAGQKIVVRNFSLDNPQLLLFQDIDEIVRRADVSAEKRQLVQNLCARSRKKYFANFNIGLAPEERPTWQEMCRKAYPGEKFDF